MLSKVHMDSIPFPSASLPKTTFLALARVSVVTQETLVSLHLLSSLSLLLHGQPEDSFALFI